MCGILIGHLQSEPCVLFSLPSNLGIAVDKTPFQSGEPFPENSLMLAYAGWIGRFRELMLA